MRPKPDRKALSYAYTLDAAGHRTQVTELSGRTVNYGYDNLYRLTSETIASDPNSINGAVSYAYDPVGESHAEEFVRRGREPGGEDGCGRRNEVSSGRAEPHPDYVAGFRPNRLVRGQLEAGKRARFTDSVLWS